jgi:hypothetical protein
VAYETKIAISFCKERLEKKVHDIINPFSNKMFRDPNSIDYKDDPFPIRSEL